MKYLKAFESYNQAEVSSNVKLALESDWVNGHNWDNARFPMFSDKHVIEFLYAIAESISAIKEVTGIKFMFLKNFRNNVGSDYRFLVEYKDAIQIFAVAIFDELNEFTTIDVRSVTKFGLSDRKKNLNQLIEFLTGDPIIYGGSILEPDSDEYVDWTELRTQLISKNYDIE